MAKHRQTRRVTVSKPKDPVEAVDRHEIRAIARAIAPAAYTEFMNDGGGWANYQDAAASAVNFAEAVYAELVRRER